MKIVFVITDYGSFNNFLGELAAELTKKNEVHVICDKIKIIDYQDKFPYVDLGIHFHYIQFSRDFQLVSKIISSYKIKRILNAIKPDIVNLHFTTGIFSSVLSGRIPFRTIGVFHGLGSPVISNPVKRFIFKQIELFCFKRLDQIWVLNVPDHLVAKERFPHISFKYNSYGVGCDLDKFNMDLFNDKQRKDLRKEINIEPNDFVLMFTGRFVHFKGFDLLIKALKHIDENNIIKNIKLIIAGGLDKAHSTNLTSQEINYLHNSKKIINIGFTNEVEKFLSISDVFVFPSRREGMPVCIMEAVSMGVPVITLDSRGCNDLVINDCNGKLLPLNADYLSVSNSIVNLYNNRSELSFLSQNAVSQRLNFDRKSFIRESVEIFDNVYQNC